jgi:hypothetical protein
MNKTIQAGKGSNRKIWQRKKFKNYLRIIIILVFFLISYSIYFIIQIIWEQNETFKKTRDYELSWILKSINNLIIIKKDFSNIEVLLKLYKIDYLNDKIECFYARWEEPNYILATINKTWVGCNENNCEIISWYYLMWNYTGNFKKKYFEDIKKYLEQCEL